ncbi:hypothetical protein [Arcobacter sp.]|uniref:hypothetical protein n=1 Tax=Arcobacter sp. TaxID=1872629 RepID=UPI003D10626E
MYSKKWIRTWFIIIIIIIIPIVGGFNYIIDPYGLYNTNIINKPKIKQSDKMRLIKAIKTQEIKPVSICLGTSRTEGGYDPTHKYFLQPAYNLAVSGSSMYEARIYFENALKQGRLKKVLLVSDYIMFSMEKKKQVNEFETYFKENSKKYLFSLDTFIDSLNTLVGTNKSEILYYENGQRLHNYKEKYLYEIGGHSEAFKINETYSYEKNTNNYTYKDTGENAFIDFEFIVNSCYQNNIKLDIIFGPSHIRQWEAFNYKKSFDKWQQWKKDVVISVNKIASRYNKKQFRIMDFAVYHPLTAEEVPTDKNVKMKYYWESNHYKNELGSIVLDKLIGDSQYKYFGAELNFSNIDEHLESQKVKRHQYIDTKAYQIEVWGKEKKSK